MPFVQNAIVQLAQKGTQGVVSDLCILTNGKRVVGSPGHTVLVFRSLYYTPIFFIFPVTQCLCFALCPHIPDIFFFWSHSCGYSRFYYHSCSLWLRVCRGGHIPVSRYKAKKKCKATYCYLTPIYILIYTFVVLFSYFPRLAVLQYQYKEQRYHTHPIDK